MPRHAQNARARASKKPLLSHALGIAYRGGGTPGGVELRESVYESLDNATFPLIDSTPHLPKIPNSQHYVSTYSGASRSVLLGCGPPLGADDEEEADKT